MENCEFYDPNKIAKNRKFTLNIVDICQYSDEDAPQPQITLN